LRNCIRFSSFACDAAPVTGETTDWKGDWRWWLLFVALMGWVTGFWWCRGRWEHNLWLQWLVLPAFACNGDRIWELWQRWLADFSLRWLALFSLIEWQFWLTGFRAGDWWGSAGSGKDFALLVVLISSLVLLAEDERARKQLWQVVFGIGALAVFVSLLLFYQDYTLSEERFRLVWRYAPGFNAVTTGLLAGFALVVGFCGATPKVVWQRWLWRVALLVMGFALAASESRGALLASLGGLMAYFVVNRCGRDLSRRVAFPALGFFLYWMGVSFVSEESGALIERGSAGRFAIYETYLSKLSGSDWFFGKGVVPMLPEAEMGWLVHHTHCAYLGQLVAYGLPALLGLVAILGWGLWKLRNRDELPLYVFGLIAVLFDGGMIFSVLSLARWEVLVVAVPLVVGLAARNQGDQAREKRSFSR
jgi:hypothetical protein